MNKEELVSYLKDARFTVSDQTAVKGIELYPEWAVGIERRQIHAGIQAECVDWALFQCGGIR